MQHKNNDLYSALSRAISDFERDLSLLRYAADEQNRRGLNFVRKDAGKFVSKAPLEYLEADTVAWSAENLEHMIFHLKAVQTRVKKDKMRFNN